jgi:hypothetical protein
MRWGLLLLLACGKEKEPEDTSGRSPDDPPPLEGPLLLISETSTGTLVIHDTSTDTRVGSQCLSELHPEDCATGTHNLADPCLMFGVVPEVEDGQDVLTISYTLRNPDLSYAPGAVSRIRPGHPPTVDWTISSLRFPEALLDQEGLDCPAGSETAGCHLFGTHIAIPDPSGEVIIADTSNSRVLWVRPLEDEPGLGEVTAVLSTSHGSTEAALFVNHLQRIESGDAVWLLATYKGQKSGEMGEINAGRIVLWDITERDDPVHLWTYPGSGRLAAVHHGTMHQTPEGPRLLYAHSLGASAAADESLGSIGIAEWSGASPPRYIGDGLLDVPESLGFVRSVAYTELINALLVTDSGCENPEAPCERSAAIWRLSLPAETPSGLSGAWTSDHSQQRFFSLDAMPLHVPDKLELPFAAQLLPLTSLADPLGLEPLGRCP